MLARRTLTAIASTGALVIGLAFSAGSSDAASRVGYVVVYHDGVSVDATTDNLERAHTFVSTFRYSVALNGFAARLSPSQVAALRAHPAVSFVSLDEPVHAIGTAPLAAGETVPTGISRIEAVVGTNAKPASDVNVAVIDTGIDLKHADLNAVPGKKCVISSLTTQDDNGHGTHVAGTIAAKNQGAGVLGVAPGTKLYSVKVLDRLGSGSISTIVCGIDWVTANGPGTPNNIHVANMSLGGAGAIDDTTCATTTDAMRKAICKSVAKGITYVVAAGNSAKDLAGFRPASYPEVLTVTAMSDSDGKPGGTGPAPACKTGETDDKFASFSNFAVAQREIDHTIAGPGVCILSTKLGGGTTTLSGTSMASPHLAGVVALCIGNAGVAGPCAGKTPAEVVQLIRADAKAHNDANLGYGFEGDPIRPVPDKYFGYLVSAAKY